MDNPFSWLMIIVFGLILVYYVCLRAAIEQKENKRENEKFFKSYF